MGVMGVANGEEALPVTGFFGCLDAGQLVPKGRSRRKSAGGGGG